MAKKSKKTVPRISTENESNTTTDIDTSDNEDSSIVGTSSEIKGNKVTSKTDKVSTPKDEQSSDENNDNPVTIYVDKLNKYVENIAKMNSELKHLVSVGKTLEKDFNHIVKLLAKKNKNKSNENRALTGFAMPIYLTDEMHDFLKENTEMKLEKGQKVHRIAVTRMLNKYIKDQGLRKEEDKRFIDPNITLHRLFRSTEKDEVSYFNLQKYIKHHFIKEYKVTK